MNFIQNQNNRGKKVFDGKKLCYCCGKSGHSRFDCRFENYQCLCCKQVGHLAAVCRSNDNTNNNNSDRKLRDYHNERRPNNGSYKKADNVKFDNGKMKHVSHNYVDEIVEVGEQFNKMFAMDASGRENVSKRDVRDVSPIKIGLLIDY